MKRVTERRLRYFTEMYRQMGLPRQRARRRALMLYLSYIGVFDCLRLGLAEMGDADLAAQAREVLSTLVP